MYIILPFKAFVLSKLIVVQVIPARTFAGGAKL